MTTLSLTVDLGIHQLYIYIGHTQDACVEHFPAFTTRYRKHSTWKDLSSQGLINGENGMHHGKFTAKAKNSCFLLSALELLVFICAAYVLHIHCMLAQFYT